MALRLFNRKPKMKIAGEATVTPPLMQILQLLDGSPAGYGAVYRQVSPVRAVVDYLADAIATTPMKVYRREDRGRPEVTDHPFTLLLQNPNPDLTEYRLFHGLAADLLIYGNAYWRKVQIGTLKQLVPLPPFRVTPRGGDLLRASAYDFFPPDGRPPQRFSSDEIVHFHTYDPEEPRVGSSKLAALRTTVLEEVEASKYRLGYWQNHAQLEGALEHPDQLSQEAQDRLSQNFDQRWSGSANAGKTPVFEEGMKWVSISSTPHDAEFIAGREFVLEATCRVYNLPVALMGLTKTATYASEREKHKELYTDVLPPWYDLIQSEIELQVMPWFVGTENFYCEFLADAKLRGDFIDRATILNTAVGRPWMSVGEARGIENLPDRRNPDDDELVVPVGPNYALEGMAEDQAALAPVADLPVASSLGAFFDRQQRSVTSRMGAGHQKAFDRTRWDRELAEIVGSVTAAAEINNTTEYELRTGKDPAAVFADARRRALSA